MSDIPRIPAEAKEVIKNKRTGNLHKDQSRSNIKSLIKTNKNIVGHLIQT